MPNRNTHYWFCFMLFVGGWGVRWEGVGVEMNSYLVAFHGDCEVLALGGGEEMKLVE